MVATREQHVTTLMLDVTLASADAAILLCWEEKVKQKKDCSLLLQSRGGRVITTIKVIGPRNHEVSDSNSSLPPEFQAETKKKKTNRQSNKLKLAKLPQYHQRKVEEEGLPPSRLMLEQAAAAPAKLTSPEPNSSQEKFQCDKCDYKTETLRGLNVHIGRKHKEPEILRSDQQDTSLDLSDAEEEREHSFSLTNTTTTHEESDLEFTSSAESECGQCDFIGNSRTAIEEHIVNNHSECTRCKSKFETTKDIRNHSYDYEACDLAHVNMVIQMGGRVVPLR